MGRHFYCCWLLFDAIHYQILFDKELRDFNVECWKDVFELTCGCHLIRHALNQKLLHKHILELVV